LRSGQGSIGQKARPDPELLAVSMCLFRPEADIHEKQEPRRSGVGNSHQRLPYIASRLLRAVSCSRRIARPASTQSQGMGQLLEPSGRLSDNLPMLRPIVGTLPHCLPNNVLVEAIVNATLQQSAALTCSVCKNRCKVNCPLMREYTAHDPFPLSARTRY